MSNLFVVTLSGDLGSGKTTVGHDLATMIGWRFESVGNRMRYLAQQAQMTLAEFNALSEKDLRIDRDLDRWQMELYENSTENMIVDGRLSWHFIPGSFKIYLAVDEQEAARRIWNSKRTNENKAQSLEETLEANRRRLQSDILRYHKIYGVNPYERHHYDLVIDTSHKTPSEIIEELSNNLKENLYWI